MRRKAIRREVRVTLYLSPLDKSRFAQAAREAGTSLNPWLLDAANRHAAPQPKPLPDCEAYECARCGVFYVPVDVPRSPLCCPTCGGRNVHDAGRWVTPVLGWR